MKLLLQFSFSGALMILVIAGLRAILQRRLHRSVWLVLWALVVLRLLVPVSIPAPTSFYNLFAFRQAAQAVPVFQAATAQAVKPQENWLAIVWLSGAVLVLTFVLGNYLRSLRHYRTALPCPISLPLPRGVQVRLLDGLPSPLTYGILHPTILLPAHFPLDDSQKLHHVLAHELSHIRHWDVLRKVILLVAAAIHWFNPLVWGMVYLASQDMEMRCDAKAVASLGGRRIPYAKTLVLAEEARLSSYLQVGFSHSSTEARIRALARDQAKAALSIPLCILLTIALAAIFLTGQVSAAPQAVKTQAASSAVVSAHEPMPKPSPEPKSTEPPVSIPTSDPASEEAPSAPAASMSSEPIPEPVEATQPEPERNVPSKQPPVRTYGGSSDDNQWKPQSDYTSANMQAAQKAIQASAYLQPAPSQSTLDPNLPPP